MLGHALDDIADYGSSQLFGAVSFEVVLENNLLETVNHLDTTSLSVHGEYISESDKASEPIPIEVTYGHSKDHRSDLK